MKNGLWDREKGTFSDHDTSATHWLQCLVASWQHMHMSAMEGCPIYAYIKTKSSLFGRQMREGISTLFFFKQNCIIYDNATRQSVWQCETEQYYLRFPNLSWPY